MRAGCQSLLIDPGAFPERHVERHYPQTASGLREAVEIVLRRDTPSLEETLHREWSVGQSAREPATLFSGLTAKVLA